MIEVLHVSDLHFGQSDSRNEAARSLLEGINQVHPVAGYDNRFLLVTGDITDSGDEGQYRLAREALSAFAGRVLLTPGNHDCGSFFGTDYSEDKARHFDHPFADSIGFFHPFADKRVFMCTLRDSSQQGGGLAGHHDPT